ncbi:hypothetical protein [Paraburkholderia ferrariae]|uniref:hypothetical protein n=1 Tax=Paraburkholderia ferrariae TaxID=386056 RepID=UPI0004862A27|nr:hypothetical protein [Paraburkholderia ferrariae]
MSDATNKKIMLAGVVNDQAVAWTGFRRVLAVFNAIERLTTDADSTTAALAKVGADIAEEFASAAEAAGDDYARLLEKAGGPRRG